MKSNISVSLSQIKASLPLESRKTAPLWEKHVLRPISFPVAWLLLKIGLSANQVTFFSGIAVTLGLVLMLIKNQQTVILGALLFNIWAIVIRIN